MTLRNIAFLNAVVTKLHVASLAALHDVLCAYAPALHRLLVLPITSIAHRSVDV